MYFIKHTILCSLILIYLIVNQSYAQENEIKWFSINLDYCNLDINTRQESKTLHLNTIGWVLKPLCISLKNNATNDVRGSLNFVDWNVNQEWKIVCQLESKKDNFWQYFWKYPISFALTPWETKIFNTTVLFPNSLLWTHHGCITIMPYNMNIQDNKWVKIQPRRASPIYVYNTVNTKKIENQSIEKIDNIKYNTENKTFLEKITNRFK